MAKKADKAKESKMSKRAAKKVAKQAKKAKQAKDAQELNEVKEVKAVKTRDDGGLVRDLDAATVGLKEVRVMPEWDYGYGGFARSGRKYAVLEKGMWIPG